MSYGIILDHPKKDNNIGGVLRSAQAFNASMIGLIGASYKHQSTDTGKASRHLPVSLYPDDSSFLITKPIGWDIVAVEFVDDSENLPSFAHPKSALYIFGPEDGSVSNSLMKIAKYKLKIPSKYCLNLATAASIVMYDRIAKCSK